MRQGNNQRRGRGRSGRRPNVPNRNQTFDSNGPEGRVRGTAQQVYDKYLALARDAQVSGDRILTENFLQFAEHYFRVLNDSTDPDENRDRQRQNGDDRQARSQDESFGDEADDEGQAAQGGGQPAQVNGGGRERSHRRDDQRRDDYRRDERPRFQDRRGGRDERPAEAVETGTGDEGREKQVRDTETSAVEAPGGEGGGKPFETAPPLSERRARRQSREPAPRNDERAGVLTAHRPEDEANAETSPDAAAPAADAPRSAEAGSDEGLRKMLGDRPRRAPRRRRTAASEGEALVSAPATGDGEAGDSAPAAPKAAAPKTTRARTSRAKAAKSSVSEPQEGSDSSSSSDATADESGNAAT